MLGCSLVRLDCNLEKSGCNLEKLGYNLVKLGCNLGKLGYNLVKSGCNLGMLASNSVKSGCSSDLSLGIQEILSLQKESSAGWLESMLETIAPDQATSDSFHLGRFRRTRSVSWASGAGTKRGNTVRSIHDFEKKSKKSIFNIF